jgi:hypothetical protein
MKNWTMENCVDFILYGLIPLIFVSTACAMVIIFACS